MIATMQVSRNLILLSILLVSAVGCAAPSTQPAEAPTLPPMPTATVPPTSPPVPTVAANVPDGWETYSNQEQCGFAISHPSNMEVTGEGTNSFNLSVSSTEPVGLVPNFVYVSLIPNSFQGGAGEIYNYDPAATEILLKMQVGESGSVNPVPDFAPGFTYTRLPDTTLSNHVAQTYENTQPWEFPAGTKEIRYYLKANGCTYLFGGYMATVGSGQFGEIDEKLFYQIIATFQVSP